MSQQSDEKPSFNPLLYPVSVGGLVHLIIITTCFYVRNYLHSLSQGAVFMTPFLVLCLRVIFAILVIALGYFFYYLAECVRDSAKAGTRAPASINNAPGWNELLSEFGFAVLAFAGCFLPAMLIYGNTGNLDAKLWTALAVGMWFFPMLYLRAALFSELRMFNPFEMIRSIAKTFVDYHLLVVGLIFVADAFVVTQKYLQNAPFISNLLLPLFIYLSMVCAHLIGRYYLKNTATLNWDVL